MFSIEKRVTLQNQELGAIAELAAACDRADGTRNEIDCDKTLNSRPSMPSFFWVKGEAAQWSGLASVFAPELETAELEILVRPESRRAGLGSALLAAVEAELRGAGYRELLLLRDAASAAGGAFVERFRAERGAVLDHREFAMILRPESYAAVSGHAEEVAASASISVGSAADLPGLVELRALKSGEPEQDVRSFLEATLAVSARTVLVARAKAGGEALGMVSVFAEPGGTASINGLIVAPNARRGGLGSALLDAGVRTALAKGASRVGLEVDALNQGALGIYLRRGFEQVSEIEYWRASLG